jgi:hypothetical protein
MLSRLLSAALIAFAALLLSGPSVRAQELVGSYVARLSAQDHFNSRGLRLNSAAAIIRQDRANFHEFGVTDPEDGGDDFFLSRKNRSLLEQFLANGTASPDAISAIVNGTPLIRVDIYRKGRRHFVHVSLL